jgi:hypothetical protein
MLPMPPAKAGEVTIIMIAALKSSFFMTLSLSSGYKHGATSAPTGSFVAGRQLRPAGRPVRYAG